MALNDYINKSSIKKAVSSALVPLAITAGSFYASPKAEAQNEGGYDWTYTVDNPGVQNYRELRTVADAEATYGVGSVPSYVKNDITEILSPYDPLNPPMMDDSQTLKIVIGPGTFTYNPVSSDDFLYTNMPTKIESSSGNPTNSDLAVPILSFRFMAYDAVTLSGQAITFDGDGSIGFLDGGGYLENSILTNYGAIQYDPRDDFTMVDNTFTSLNTPTAVWVNELLQKSSSNNSLIFQKAITDYNLTKEVGTKVPAVVSIARNSFEGVPVAFLLKYDVDAGSLGAIANGNNYFNVTTVVKDEKDGGSQDFTGNAWDNGAKTLITDPSQILTNFVIDNGGATVIDVTSALGYIPKADNDGDGLVNYLEAQTYGTNMNDSDSDNDLLTDGEEVLQYGTNPNAQDTDGDGHRDSWEVSHGTDPNDNLSFPIENEPLPAVPVAGLVGLLLTGGAIAGAGALYSRRRKARNPFQTEF